MAKKRRKKSSALGRYTKDVAMFGAGSMVTGAAAMGVAPYGAHYTAGIAQVGAGLPSIAPLVTMKAQVGMLGEAMKTVKKIPKMRRHKKKRMRY